MAAQINLQPAHEVARQEFGKVLPDVVIDNALVEFNQNESFFKVPFIGKEYRIFFPDGKVEYSNSDEEVPLAVQIVLLHYLARSSPRKVEGTKITFKELPSGSIYVGPFTNRAIKPLVSIFGDKPDKLVDAAKKIGGWVEDMGDAAVTVPVLPKIPVTFVLWEGDDEFSPSGNILFDISAPSHMHTEDYALLPGLAIFELKKQAQI